MNRFVLALLALLLLSAPRFLSAQDRGAAALGELVSGLGMSARVLMIGAHPDDEDTPLIAWLARGRHADVAYLSLTRGDGGQNLIGNELGEALGVIRTEELLAARRIDGGTQYFTRAYDFGFSKNADETLRHWDRDSILGDMVRVVRMFRPHIIVPVFSGTPRDGHGHHQVAGILGREVFDAALDTVRFPVHWFGEAWTPLKLYGSRRFAPEQATLRINVGEYSPLLGRTYAEIAAESRSQHKSQGFGVVERKGVVWSYVARERTRVNEGTRASSERSIFDGMDTTLTRLKAAIVDTTAPPEMRPVASHVVALRAAIDSLITAVKIAQRKLDLIRPATMIPSLAHVVEWTAHNEPPPCASGQPQCAVGAGPVTASGASVQPGTSPDYRASMDAIHARAQRALALATGVEADAFVSRETLAPGDTLAVTYTVYNQGGHPVRVSGGSVSGSSIDYVSSAWRNALLRPDSSLRMVGVLRVGIRPIFTQPRWLRVPRVGDQFAVPCMDSACLEPFHTEVVLPGTFGTVAAGSMITFDRNAHFMVGAPVVHRRADPVRGDVRSELQVAPAISVTLDREIEYAPANVAIDRTVRVHLQPGGPSRREAKVALRLPPGLTADSASRSVVLDGGSSRAVEFRVQGRLAPGRHPIDAVVESQGVSYSSGYTTVEYEHITPQRLYRDAAVVLVAVDVAMPPALRRIAYIPGVGDNVAPMLAQLGLDVSMIEPAAIARTDFGAFDAVVVGTRAYQSSPELVASNARLLEYVRNGGTMVVQYGQYEMQDEGIMPYPVTLGRPQQRVTIENAPVRILRPEHRLLTTPNRITARDFEGWVQERSLYMPVDFDDRYTPLLSMRDPGETPNEGAILVARYGRGTYVYTTLSLFRQLPAGVPGPARLFVNMLAAGADTAPRARGEAVP